MAEVTFQISTEINEIIVKHPEIHWDRLVRKNLWDYARKIQLMDKITSKSKLTQNDVDNLDRIIKTDLLKRYR